MIEKMTVGEIARLWKEDKRKYVKYSTFAAYALSILLQYDKGILHNGNCFGYICSIMSTSFPIRSKIVCIA